MIFGHEYQQRNCGNTFMQIPVKSLFFLLIILTVGCIAIIDTHAENSWNKLTVSTDKPRYQQEEKIKITFENNLQESVFSHIRSLTPIYCIKHIEKQINGAQWVRLYAQCQFPNCTYEIDRPGELKPGENASFEWTPRQFIRGTAETALLEPGIYRLAITYQNHLRNKWEVTYTNNFTIHSGREK